MSQFQLHHQRNMLTLKKMVCYITCGLALTSRKDSTFCLFPKYHVLYIRCIMLAHVTIEWCVSMLVGCLIVPPSIFRVRDQQKTWVNESIVIF